MTVILKIMQPGDLRPASDQSATYKLITGVSEVEFTRDLHGQAYLDYALDAPPITTTTSPGRSHREQLLLSGMVFVMSEAGKTISSFDGQSTAVDVLFDDKPIRLSSGPLCLDALREALEAPAEVFRRSERRQGYVWERVGHGSHTLWIVAGDVFASYLRCGDVVDDPPILAAEEPVRLPTREARGLDERIQSIFDAKPKSRLVISRSADGEMLFKEFTDDKALISSFLLPDMIAALGDDSTSVEIEAVIQELAKLPAKSVSTAAYMTHVATKLKGIGFSKTDIKREVSRAAQSVS